MRVVFCWLLILVCLASVACDDDEAQPARAPLAEESETPPGVPDEEAPAVETPSDEAQDDEAQDDEAPRDDVLDECPLVVLDPDPPLRVRSGPSSDSEMRGQLDNGTIVQSVERRDGYVRITTPVAGWVFHGMLMRTCDAPPALPALPLGRNTYLLLPSPHREQGADPGTALPPPPMEPEFVTMRFSFRNARAIETPTPITLVTASGSCERRATRRVLLIGTCPSNSYSGEYSTAMQALEVPSCPELLSSPNEDDSVHMTTPMMVGLVGHHEDSHLETWPHSEAPLTVGQRRAIERKVQQMVAAMHPDDRGSYTSEIPETRVRFEGSPWSWSYLDLGEQHLLFHGDALMDSVDLTANFPRRVRAGTNLLVGVGSSGQHGYGFYMFPDEARRGLVRDLNYPTFSCSSY